MNVRITVHRSVPRHDLERIVCSIPEKVLKEIDLPPPNKVAGFEKYFIKSEGVMLLAKDLDSGDIVGTISALRTPLHYITREDLVSKKDPIPISKEFRHEIIGAYIPEPYRRFGIYSRLRNVLEAYAIENDLSLYSIVRHHPESRRQALELLSKVLKVDKSKIERNYKEIYRRLSRKQITRAEIASVEPSIGLVHPDAVSVFHRWSKLVEQGDARLLGYWIESFSPAFLFTPSAEYRAKLKELASKE